MNQYFKRKWAYALIVIVSFVLVAVLVLSVNINNGSKSNTDNNQSVVIEAPQFSKESGFYTNPFYLKLSHPSGCKVYYTLDSSDPDENSIEYTEPIYLDNATENENVYSMRTDVSTGFYEDIINKYEKYNEADNPPGYVAPDYLVDKCNVIRAVAIDEYGAKSTVVTKTYFVGLSPKEYKGCNIISIVTDPENLFNKKTGIYVTGDKFEQYLKSDDIGNSYYGKRWRFWDANYRQKGSDWEREATMCFIGSDGKALYSKDGGIRVQGGISRGTLPRSLNLYSDKKYDGKELFEYDLFDDGKNYHSLTLSSGGNQLITQFNDYMMSQRMKNVDYSLMKFQPYVLFLDGEYWGFYWLTTKFDETYISNEYNTDKEVIIVKNGKVSSNNSDIKKLYESMRFQIINSDLSQEKNYKDVCDIIDINSFVDYYATQIYIARNTDWPIDNYELWRTVSSGTDEYSDCKWRWMLFDSNSPAMRKDLVNHNTLDYVIENDELFASMWNNEEFRKSFEKRILEIASNNFNSDEMCDFIDDYQEKMFPIMSKSWERFYGKNNDKSTVYYESMNGYKIFFNGRKETVESWFD